MRTFTSRAIPAFTSTSTSNTWGSNARLGSLDSFPLFIGADNTNHTPLNPHADPAASYQCRCTHKQSSTASTPRPITLHPLWPRHHPAGNPPWTESTANNSSSRPSPSRGHHASCVHRVAPVQRSRFPLVPRAFNSVIYSAQDPTGEAEKMRATIRP
jgi:hypothetical protein